MTDSEDAAVYRAPMRSRDPRVSADAGVHRALAVGVCGLAGTVSPPPQSLDEAVARLLAQHGERVARRVRRFAHAETGAWVWTRERAGEYWLGRLDGPWGYDDSPEAREADLVHVRPCRWGDRPVPEHEVPAGVLHSFARGGLNWQRIHAPGTGGASRDLWRDVAQQGR